MRSLHYVSPRLILSFLSTLFVFTTAGPALAQGPPCKPCAGVVVENPDAIPSLLAAAPRLDDEARLYVAWPVSLLELDGRAAERARALREAGARPWLRLLFRTPSPVLENADRLAAELKAAAAIAKNAGEGAHFQIVWLPENAAENAASGAEMRGEFDVEDYAFLFKRASVAVAGASNAAPVITTPLPADGAWLERFYDQEIAAYAQGIALRPAAEGALEAALARLAELDPGKPVILDAAPWPSDPWLTVSEAARWAAAGFSLSLFEGPGFEGAGFEEPGQAGEAELDQTELDQAWLAPLKLLAREFQGDLALDPTSAPEGAAEAWSFVRGEDLQLRVVARPREGASELELRFPDAQLTRPSLLDPETGEARDLFGQRRTADSFIVPVSAPGAVALLRVERMSAAEIEGLEGVEDELTVAGEREVPVEEILRRLQAFEDDQARRLDRYQAINTMHLRFAAGTGVQGFEATLEGPFFFRRGGGFDWAWETLYFNGVRWRAKELPEFPLLEPEKAAALPLEINFTKEYTYRLRGTDSVGGRDCWVVDFSPSGEAAPGRTLYQGTVWIDREHHGQVRARALQLGLEGQVLSNEETFYFSPVDPATGKPGEWTAENLWIPMRIVGQQLLSVLNSTIAVEKETQLSALVINGEDFDTQRQATLDSDNTMVRDTDKGLRYLIKNEETGEREVQTEFDKTRRFAVAGIFWDESQDFPLPLGGIDYFSFDFRGKGQQLNVFFAGALLTVNLADPDLFGSKWDAGANIFALAVAGSNVNFRDGIERPEEKLENRPSRVALMLGRPLGSFGKLDLTYSLRHSDYGRADTTGEEFVLPQDHFTQGLSVETRYNRSGYRLRLAGSQSLRSEWQPWGLPGSSTLDAFDPDTEEYTLWGASAAKTWWLPNFQKAGVEVEYHDGRNLDRFSKYEFGYFSSVRVHGYQSDKVRATDAFAAHLTYGFEVGELLRLELIGDGAWASDEESGLDREFLGGVGVAGNFIGPWNTLVNLDVGVAVAGPDDGVSVFLTFLKLFR